MTTRSFALDAAALLLLAAIVIILLVLTGFVRAEPMQSRTFYDSMGREVGRADKRGSTTTFHDAQGRETGRAERRPDGTVKFFNERGQEIGTSKDRHGR
jgi:hypothetical protein